MASVPEVAGGIFGGAEAPGGCPWRFEEARDGRPWVFLLKARDRGTVGGTYSKEDAVPAVVRDPVLGDGEGGSWHVLGDIMIESSAEISAGKPSLGTRESGVVSTVRSA